MLGKMFFSGALNLKNSKRWPTWQNKEQYQYRIVFV